MHKSTVLTLVVTATIIFLGAGFSPARGRTGRAPADDKQEHLHVGGVDRTYFLHVPALSPDSAPALVLVFHGGGGHASTMPHFTHFDAVADREGPQYLPVFLVGKASSNLDATEAIWGFFRKHSW
jgi:poly(3-hydroxybutyrate) depolymerase